jgi:hypothetical protein
LSLEDPGLRIWLGYISGDEIGWGGINETPLIYLAMKLDQDFRSLIKVPV